MSFTDSDYINMLLREALEYNSGIVAIAAEVLAMSPEQRSFKQVEKEVERMNEAHIANIKRLLKDRKAYEQQN